ncbi:MAG: hypothetical protein J6T71_05175 [Paludibacteraceae bacterium]|nr:hypothetical protein [Paludibacteraceae bacterium]
MKLTQEQIDKIYKYSELSIVIIFFGGLFVLCILPKEWGNWPFWTWLGLFIASILVCAIFKGYATDEEEEKFKKAVRDAVQEAQIETQTKAKRAIIESREVVECPLVDLNERQKQAVEDLLRRRIPKHAKDETRFDRAVVYNYLRALRSMHVLNPVRNSEDIDTFRKWIEQITGLYEPQEEWAHFRGDYEDFKRSNRKIQDAVKELTGEIEKFR